jgi:phosphoglucosamine mutase
VPDLFLGLGADVTAINASPDGRNINQDCGSLHLEKLRSAVIHEKADFGVAFDGDADRALFVDERAEVIDGDAVLWILAKYLKQCGGLPSGKVVATVMSNIGLERALAEVGVELIRTSVGDKYVLEELMRCGSELGGEQSGHIILPNTSFVGDGIMTGLFILQAIQDQGQKFSETHAGFVKYPQILVNVPVKEKRPFYQVLAIANAAGAIERKLDGEGRLLLRYSGTENLARVMIEGKDQSEIDALANSLADVIRGELG